MGDACIKGNSNRSKHLLLQPLNFMQILHFLFVTLISVFPNRFMWFEHRYLTAVAYTYRPWPYKLTQKTHTSIIISKKNIYQSKKIQLLSHLNKTFYQGSILQQHRYIHIPAYSYLDTKIWYIFCIYMYTVLSFVVENEQRDNQARNL